MEYKTNPSRDRCLAAACQALEMRPTFPVVFFLDAMAFSEIGAALRRNGVTTLLVPDQSARFPPITRKANHRTPSRSYQLKDYHRLWTGKFYSWLLTDYDRVIYYDVDVWWQKSPALVFQVSVDSRSEGNDALPSNTIVIAITITITITTIITITMYSKFYITTTTTTTRTTRTTIQLSQSCLEVALLGSIWRLVSTRTTSRRGR